MKGGARRFYNRWYFWTTHSRLQPVVEVTKTRKRRLGSILTYLPHRITNALNGSINAQVEKVKRMAGGDRNRAFTATACISILTPKHNILGLPIAFPDELHKKTNRPA